MQLSRSKCLGIIGRHVDACADIREAMLTDADELEGLPQYYGALAASSATMPLRAGQHLARAVRVARAIPDATLAHDLLLGMDGVRDLTTDAAAVAPAPDVDSAVALIELGGHPRILGREALAVLDAAGCARALALVADGPAGPRVIEARGWTAAEAAAAAAAPGPVRPDPPRPPPRRALAARRRSAPRARPSLHAHRHPQADRHRPDARPLPPRGEAARRPVARRGARRRPREHLGLRTDGRAAQRRAAHRADAALHPADRRNRDRQGDAGARHPPRLRSRRPPAPPVQLHRRPARHAREPAVRLPQGGVHRRRHLVPRRHPIRGRRARSFSTRSPTSTPTSSRSCCASSRPTRSTRSASRSRSRSTSA